MKRMIFVALAGLLGLGSVIAPAGAQEVTLRVHSFLPLADGKVVACVTVRREAGRRQFSTRDRAIVCTLHGQAGWKCGAASRAMGGYPGCLKCWSMPRPVEASVRVVSRTWRSRQKARSQ